MEKLKDIIVTKICEARTVYSPKGRVEKMVNRKHYGLSFCAEGQITYIHNGVSYVSDSRHAVILPKGQSYTIHGDKTGVFPVLNFECANFLCNTVTVIPVDNVEPLIKDYEQIKSLLLFEMNKPKIMSIFYRIISLLSDSDGAQNGILAPATEYLKNNYASCDLTNDVLARKCRISEVYFRKLFAEAYGITPKQYIINARINKAKQLLEDGAMQINAVSEQCGFSDAYHFCRLFRQKTGMTPTEYRKRNRISKI